mgnify:CR=1 FL=1
MYVIVLRSLSKKMLIFDVMNHNSAIKHILIINYQYGAVKEKSKSRSFTVNLGKYTHYRERRMSHEKNIALSLIK